MIRLTFSMARIILARPAEPPRPTGQGARDRGPTHTPRPTSLAGIVAAATLLAACGGSDTPRFDTPAEAAVCRSHLAPLREALTTATNRIPTNTTTEADLAYLEAAASTNLAYTATLDGLVDLGSTCIAAFSHLEDAANAHRHLSDGVSCTDTDECIAAATAAPNQWDAIDTAMRAAAAILDQDAA